MSYNPQNPNGQATMANSSPVVIASNQSAIPVTFSGSATDNTQLLSTTLNATGATSAIDTTGYSSVVLQLGGSWVGSLVVEGSLDNSSWELYLIMDVNESKIQDVITSEGVYSLKTTSKYIRLNVQQLTSGSITALVLGRTVNGIDAIDALSLAMDRNNNMPLYVQETGTKKDLTQALIPSDAPTPIYGSASINNGIVALIDTTGYQSATIQLFGTFTATANCFYSNDGVNFSAAANLYSVVGGGNSVAILAMNFNGLFVIPVYAKYLKIQISAYTSGTLQALVYLRQQPFTGAMTVNENLALINGSTPTSTGITGMLAVGGAGVVGGNVTGNPVLMGGADPSGLTRRLLLDSSGRIINVGTDASGTTRSNGVVPPASGIQNVPSQTVQDTSQFEGQSSIELLAQILTELKINNQYLYELPGQLQRAFSTLNNSNNTLDFSFRTEPNEMRNDATLFAN